MFRRLLPTTIGGCRIQTTVAPQMIAGRLSSEKWRFRRWTNTHAIAGVAMCLAACLVAVSITWSIANYRKPSDREQLQGIWVSSNQQPDSALVFKDDELIWIREESAHRWKFKIDETKAPKWLDLSQETPAPLGFQVRKVIDAIYKLDGDELTIRLGEHFAEFEGGEKQQPVQFKRKTH